MSIREGKWRCTYCSVVNRGADLRCTGCGATRDKDVTFFVEEEAPEVLDAEMLKRAEAGADWLCAFCQTSNRPEADRCGNCGAERGTSPSQPVFVVGQPLPSPSQPARPASHWGLCVLGALVTLLLGIGVAAFLFTNRQSEEAVRVSAFEWERTIEVEALRMAQEQAWDGEVPSGAREISRQQDVYRTEREQVGTRKVKVGTKNLGNGFFKDLYEDRPVYRDKPVYRVRIRYEIPRWGVVRTARASGNDQSPRWPDTPRSATERDGRRSERYTVILEGRKTYRMDLAFERWSSLRSGQSLRAVIRGESRVVSLS